MTENEAAGRGGDRKPGQEPERHRNHTTRLSESPLVFDEVPDPLLKDSSGKPALRAKVRLTRAGRPFHVFPGNDGTRVRLDFEVVSYPGTRLIREPPRPNISIHYVFGCRCRNPIVNRRCLRSFAPGPRSKFVRDVTLALRRPPHKGMQIDFDDIFGRGQLFLVELATVTTDRNGNGLSPVQHYSKLSRLLGLAQSHEWLGGEDGEGGKHAGRGTLTGPVATTATGSHGLPRAGTGTGTGRRTETVTDTGTATTTGTDTDTGTALATATATRNP